MRNKFQLSAMLAVLALAACSSVKVVASKEKLAAVKKIALLETVLEKPGVTAMSGLKQGATEAKFAAISGDLNKVATGVIDQYRDIMAKKLATELNATVVSGKQLAKAHADAAGAGFPEFPVSAYTNEFIVAQASGEKNYIDAPEGEFGKYLPNADMSKLAAHFCQKLGVDAIAVSFSKIVFIIQQDKAILGTAVVIYDKNGERIFLGSGTIEPPLEVSGAGDIAGFTKLSQKHVYERTLGLVFAKLKEGN